MSFTIEYVSYRPGIIAVIYIEKYPKREYLSLHRIDAFKGWSLLKGSMEEGESVEDTAERETKEETNIEDFRIQIIPGLKVKYEFPSSWRRHYRRIGQEEQAVAIEFKPKARNTLQVDFKEHDDYNWAEFQETRSILKFDEHKKALEVADKFITKNMKK